MNFLKKAIFAPLAFVAAAASVQAVAAPMEHTIQLQATVPTEEFYVLPVENNWIGDVQILGYNPLTKELTSLSKQFYVLNSSGTVHGKLLSPATMHSPDNNIDLKVSFNSKELTPIGQEVVGVDQALTQKIVTLEVTPVKPTGGYEAGVYQGNVQLSFDAVI